MERFARKHSSVGAAGWLTMKDTAHTIPLERRIWYGGSTGERAQGFLYFGLRRSVLRKRIDGCQFATPTAVFYLLPLVALT